MVHGRSGSARGASRRRRRRGWEAYRRDAERYFRWSVGLTAVITAVWLFFVVTGRDGGALFKGYQISGEAVGRVAIGFVIMSVLWGWLWYGIKVLLLRKLVGFSKDEVKAVFRSRMKEPFDLPGLLERHKERRIRIADMVGRRGRFLTIGLLGFSFIYLRVRQTPTADFLFLGLQESLFDALGYSWWMIALYYSNGFLGRVAYGAQTRVMDGTLGRANCLVITMLWSVFKFLMVPIGFQLAGVFPPATYGVAVRDRVDLVHRQRRRLRDRGLALRQAEAPRLGHRRGEQEVDRGHLGLLPGARSRSASGSCSRTGCPRCGSGSRSRSRSRTRSSSSSRRAEPTTSRWRRRTRSCAGRSGRSCTERYSTFHSRRPAAHCGWAVTSRRSALVVTGLNVSRLKRSSAMPAGPAASTGFQSAPSL